MANTVLIGPAGIRKERALVSGKTITPGMLLEVVDNTLTVQPHSGAAGVVYDTIFAIEEPENQGHGIDVNYSTAGEIVQCDFSDPGQDRYALLDAGENVAAGAILNSAGDGALQDGSTNPVARALEAVNNSAGYTAVRIKVEVL